MHNGFVRVDNEKMSKSLGNFFTVREILAKYDAEVVRFFILRAHYRSPLSYTDHHIDDARQALTRLYTALKAHDAEAGPVDWNNPQAARFREAMDDDFNTPEAVAVLFELANEVNRNNSRDAAVLLKSLAAILGLMQRKPTDFLQGRDVIVNLTGVSARSEVGSVTAKTYSPDRIDQLIAERTIAKNVKNYIESDRIRKELEDAGIVLEDKPGGKTEWRRK
jgi:cysteinyl-tRNA synthetase